VSDAHGKVLAVLGRHLSTINAQNVLARVLREARLIGSSITIADVRRLVPAIERGLRLFLPAGKVDEVIAELNRAFVPTEPPKPQQIGISKEADISEARLSARGLCEQLGARRVVAQKVATVVSELARNIFMYAGTGTIELVPTAGPRPKLLVRAIDAGPGIPHLDEVLGGKYKSRTGLGAGLLGTKRLVERFEIETGPTGTRIHAEVDL
jgi:serine/threonine-protein kinase RsbT